MSRRFFCQRVSAASAVLEGSEAHHLAHVIRANVGDRVTLFDGSGQEYAATVREVGKSRVVLDLEPGCLVSRELPFRLVLGVALPKGERQKWLVEKAVELGVSRLVPLKTERGVADPSSALARLRRGVIEASKQCGRNRLMEVAEVESVSQFFGAAPQEAVRLIAQPGTGGVSSDVTGAANAFATTDRYVAIGPEGGFSDAELAAATAVGWQPISLGPRVLRVETAALAVGAFLGLGVDR